MLLGLVLMGVLVRQHIAGKTTTFVAGLCTRGFHLVGARCSRLSWRISIPGTSEPRPPCSIHRLPNSSGHWPSCSTQGRIPKGVRHSRASAWCPCVYVLALARWKGSALALGLRWLRTPAAAAMSGPARHAFGGRRRAGFDLSARRRRGPSPCWRESQCAACAGRFPSTPPSTLANRSPFPSSVNLISASPLPMQQIGRAMAGSHSLPPPSPAPLPAFGETCWRR